VESRLTQEYLIVRSFNLSDLATEVNRLLGKKEGWSCQGGVAYADGYFYLQAMVRTTPEEEQTQDDSHQSWMTLSCNPWLEELG